MTSLENVNNNYKEWIKTVSDAPSIVGVLGEESLYPIWKLVGCMADNDSSISQEVAEARMKELEDAFNAYGLENYNKLIADEIETQENKKQVEELDIEPVGVKANRSFDKNKTVSSKVQALHEGWDLGKVMLVNAKKNMDGTYTYNEDRDLQIRFRIDQNLDKLPVGNTKNNSHKVIYNENASGKVADYGNVLGNHYIKGLGKGCYFVQVTYNNQKVETVNAINFLKKMNKNDTITMLDTSTLAVEENDGIDKIVVFVTYQTSAWNVLTNPVQDWVVEAELNFE
jgi:coenzyme F420-reducing hydrogenase alpha subunit